MKLSLFTFLFLVSATFVQAQVDIGDSNRLMGEDYIAQHMATNPNWKKTNTGLVYMEVKDGTGKKPHKESTVKVRYKGYLIDGMVFDETEFDAATFRANQVIPGWTEGLQLMSEGSTFHFIIPAELAYGNNPPPETPIQAGSTLVFEVELLKVK